MHQELGSAAREQGPSFRTALLGFVTSVTLMIAAMVAAGSLGA
jgi:hypothetical protein